MKKIILLFLILAFVLTLGCVKKQVLLPVPITIDQVVPVQASSDGSYSEVFLLPATVVSDDVLAQLSQYEDVDINNLVLEAFAFTITQTSNPNAVLNGELRIAYPSNTQPVKLLDMQNLSFGQILNQPQSVELADAAVDLLETALRDIIFNQQTQDIQIFVDGNLTPAQQNLTFGLRLEITLDVVLEQCQEVFDMLGSDDEYCKDK